MNEANQTAFQFKLDWRIVSVILLTAVLVMLAIWRPWQSATASKTISVRGEATVKAAPDSFQFQPIFQDSDVKKVTALGNEAVAQLKKLGVKDADIKTTVSATADPMPAEDTSARSPDYNYNQSTFIIRITVQDKAMAQKVSDYLASTEATGQVTRVTSFSKDTRTKLDLEARSQASADAKQKAEVMAKQLGSEVGKVVSIKEDTGYGIYKLDATSGSEPSAATMESGPTIEPGTDEVNYSFTVVFELK